MGYEAEYCLHGVSYLFLVGSGSINAVIELDRNGDPIPCVTQKDDESNNQENKK